MPKGRDLRPQLAKVIFNAGALACQSANLSDGMALAPKCLVVTK